MKRRNKPLSVKVVQDVLTIEIGIDVNAFAALRSPFVYEMMGPKQERPDTRFKITSARQFALEVKGALLAEAEDGSSLLTNVLDEACRKAIEDGSLYFVDSEDEP